MKEFAYQNYFYEKPILINDIDSSEFFSIFFILFINILFCRRCLVLDKNGIRGIDRERSRDIKTA